MLSKHLFKVILGFCGVIIIGLISLVFIDSLKERDTDVKAEVPVVENQANTKIPIDSKTTKTTSTSTTKTPIKSKIN